MNGRNNQTDGKESHRLGRLIMDLNRQGVSLAAAGAGAGAERGYSAKSPGHILWPGGVVPSICRSLFLFG